MTTEQWRVEELARLSGTSVDTIRFYQKRRLLPAPRRDGRVAWYGPEHRERLARIRELRLRGLNLALIGRLVRGELDATDEPLAAAVARADVDVDAAEDFLTLDELAERTGMPRMVLDATVEGGMLVPRMIDGEARYTSGDAMVVAEGLRLLETGLPMDALLDLAREHHGRTAATAERAVALFDEHIRTPLRASELPDDVKAQQLVDAFRVLLPAVSALVAHHFRRVLLGVAQEHLEAVGEPAEIAAVNEEAARREDAR